MIDYSDILNCVNSLNDDDKAGTIILIVLSMVSGVIPYLNLRLSKRARNWPMTSGVIADSFVEENYGSDADGDSYYYYQPMVKYAYKVNERSFVNDTISFAWLSMRGTSLRLAQKVCEQFPVGNKVAVYYNPDNPADSVLKPNDTKLSWIFIIGAIIGVFVLVPVIVFSGC